MVAVENSRRKITVESVDEKSLQAELHKLLTEIDFPSAASLRTHIEHGKYTEKERIVAERIEAIQWLLG